MRVEKIIFPSEEGIELVGLMHRPNPEKDQKAGVVISHGLLSDKSGDKHKTFCETFAEAGLHAFRFDFRCSGESGERNQSDQGSITLSGEVADLSAAVRLMNRRVSRIALIGSSFGGAVSLLYASADKNISCIATIAAVGRPLDLFHNLIPAADRKTAIENWRESKRLRLEGVDFRYRIYDDASEIDVLKACEGIAVPALITHGGADEVVPLEDAELITEAIGPSATKLIFKTADHRFEDPTTRTEMIGKIVEFVIKNV